MKWLRRPLSLPPSLPKHVTSLGLPKRVIFYADGAIQPHAAGAGAIGLDDNGQVLALSNRSLKSMTNNEAEYHSLLLLLELAAPFQAIPVQVRMDSEIVIYQMRGRFSVHSPSLKALHREACGHLTNFAALSFIHVPREQNRLADALASDAANGRLWKLG